MFKAAPKPRVKPPLKHAVDRDAKVRAAHKPQFTLIKAGPRPAPVVEPKSDPLPEPQFTAAQEADMALYDHLAAADRRDEAEHEEINRKVKDKWLSLSRPEPKHILDPVPPARIKREERKNWPPGALKGEWYARGR